MMTTGARAALSNILKTQAHLGLLKPDRTWSHWLTGVQLTIASCQSDDQGNERGRGGAGGGEGGYVHIYYHMW